MRHNTIGRPAGPALDALPPLKRAARRLRITSWQTHYWIKKIIKRESVRAAENLNHAPEG